MTTKPERATGRRHGARGSRIDSAGERLAVRLAAEQGVKPVEDVDTLYGDFWPEDEQVDDFIAATKTWDQEGR
jgi:hypothetical protein